jgi:hypothetical protein
MQSGAGSTLYNCAIELCSMEPTKNDTFTIGNTVLGVDELRQVLGEGIVGNSLGSRFLSQTSFRFFLPHRAERGCACVELRGTKGALMLGGSDQVQQPHTPL